jgi:hypothetical protein
MGDRDHLADRGLDLQAIFSWRGSFDEITDAADDFARPVAVIDDLSERLR